MTSDRDFGEESARLPDEPDDEPVAGDDLGGIGEGGDGMLPGEDGMGSIPHMPVERPPH